MTEKDCQLVQNIVADPIGNGVPKWFVNRQKDFKDGTWSHLASNALESKLREDLERLKKIRFFYVFIFFIVFHVKNHIFSLNIRFFRYTKIFL